LPARDTAAAFARIASKHKISANTHQEEKIMDTISFGEYSLVYNAFSFTIAMMGAATLFFWLSRSQVADAYKVITHGVR